jgi:glycosyltransferase involved in cell wall biosynthesis
MLKNIVKRIQLTLTGALAGRAKDFDPLHYLQLNPDVAAAGADPLLHYMQYGRKEKRLYKFPPVVISKNRAFDPKRDNALLVIHECSLTGAPVLGYNIAQHLSRTMNVTVLSLGKGILEDMFRGLNVSYVGAYDARANQAIADYVVSQIARECKPRFAIVNSIESRLLVTPLEAADIPCVALIHEFASCYTDPAPHFETMMTVPQHIVFSSPLTLSDAERYIDGYAEARLHVFPQGRSDIPRRGVGEDVSEKERQRLRAILRPETDGTDADTRKYVVLGAGSVNYRKGIDLFLACAQKIAAQVGIDKCRFVWIGQGYAPRKDAAYSVYLEDQIYRSGLTEVVKFIDETTEIETAYEMSDLFLLSSRLDPLPNVAIDAMLFKKPVLCFDKTTGIASFLEEIGLKDHCVARYLDVEDLAAKASHLLVSKEARSEVAATLESHVANAFDMARYVERLVSLTYAK